MVSLVTRLLFILTIRPGSVTIGRCVRPEKIKKGKVKHDALWSPNIIGANYRTVREDGAGVGKSPREHYRRGHSILQVKGKKSDELIKVEQLPRTEEGEIDWQNIDEITKKKFWARHERIWVKPILVAWKE
jgi:hypothetical protein